MGIPFYERENRKAAKIFIAFSSNGSAFFQLFEHVYFTSTFSRYFECDPTRASRSETVGLKELGES